jgi:copper(I)-binding protein
MGVTSTGPIENASPEARSWGPPARSGAARTPRRWACGAMLAATMVAAGACGGEPKPEPKPPVARTDQAGVDKVAGSLRILAMHVTAPAGDRYPSGSDLRVIFTLVNVGTEPDALVSVSSPDARRVEIRWDRNCDGRPEVVPHLPIAPEQAPAPAKPAGAGPFDPYDLLVVAVRRDVPAGTNVPLELTFTRAGRVSTSAYVQPRSANLAEPVRRCVPSASPAQR